MNARFDRKENWRIILEAIMNEFRLSGNELATIAGIRQSTISRIARGETPNPYPATIRKLEEALNIKIVEEENRIKFIKSAREQKLVAAINNNVIFQPDKYEIEIPLINDEYSTNEIKGIMEVLRSGGIINAESIKGIIKKTILVPAESKNSIAFIFQKDTNEPYILKGDVVICSMEEKINEGDICSALLENEFQLTGRLEIINSDLYRFHFINEKYAPVDVKPENIISIVKVKKIIREIF